MRLRDIAGRHSEPLDRHIDRSRINQREAQLFPRVITAKQRPYVLDPVLSELQCRTGTGRLVGSSTEKDDFAVTRDLVVAVFQLFGRNSECAGQSSRIGQQVQWVP